MASYCFEFDMKRDRSGVCGTRAYDNDARARQAAMRMFKARAADPNDELHIYAGRKTSWGGVEGERIGKIAFDALGDNVRFYECGA